MTKPPGIPASAAPQTHRLTWRSPLHVILSTGIALALVVALFWFVPDFVTDRFVKRRVTAAFAEAYPGYALRIGRMQYGLWQNEVRCDSVLLIAADSTLSCTITRLSVRGIPRMQFIRQRDPEPGDTRNAVVAAQDIVFRFPMKQYEVRCALLQLSVPDSVMRAETLAINPLGDDEQFFANSKTRKNRVRLLVPQASARGMDYLALMQGNAYRAVSARIDNPSADVLINMDKPRTDDTSSLPWPNESLAGIAGVLHLDSLTVSNGRLKYGERFAVGARAAQITIDSLRVLAEGIANHGDSAAVIVIRAEGRVLESGRMTFLISIPVAQESNCQYSGSLSRMDLCAFDAFLETAEQVRIKSGELQSASFKITVMSGQASGSVRAVYTDFTLAAINRQTGSEAGLPDAIASFVANTFKIRGTNLPDKAGVVRLGNVHYVRKRDESFLQFSWFALRSGVQDVVGL